MLDQVSNCHRSGESNQQMNMIHVTTRAATNAIEGFYFMRQHSKHFCAKLFVLKIAFSLFC